MGDVVCEGMTIVSCGVPSGGSQGHSSWWPLHIHTHIFNLCTVLDENSQRGVKYLFLHKQKNDW